MIARDLQYDDALQVFANNLSDEYHALVEQANNLSDMYANRAPEAPGAFRRDGVVYRVQMNRETGRPYAKVLQNGSFVYVMGAIHKVREADRLTFEEACAISATIGECVVCGRTLTDPNSVAQGIGPICRTRVLGAPIKRARKGAVAA